MDRFFGYNKNKNKDRFVERGLYFLKSGTYKGSFILNIKEFDTENSKALLIMPDLIPSTVQTSGVKELFKTHQLEYVETIPLNVYSVCLAQFKKAKRVDSLNNLAK